MSGSTKETVRGIALNPPGRPQKHSDEVIAQALRDSRGVMSDAARALKYGYATIHHRIQQSAVLQAIVVEEREAMLDSARRGIGSAVIAERKRAERAEGSLDEDVPSMISSRWVIGHYEGNKLSVDVTGGVEHTHAHALPVDAEKLGEVLEALGQLGVVPRQAVTIEAEASEAD